MKRKSNTKINDENIVSKLKQVFKEEPTLSVRRAVLRIKNENIDVSLIIAQNDFEKTQKTNSDNTK